MTQYLGDLGLYSMAYVTARVDISYEPLYTYLSERDLFVKNSDGTVYTFYGMAASKKSFRLSLIDFTNPEAVKEWHKLLEHVRDFGYNGFMHDYGDCVDQDTIFYNGKGGKEFHN